MKFFQYKPFVNITLIWYNVAGTGLDAGGLLYYDSGHPDGICSGVRPA